MTDFDNSSPTPNDPRIWREMINDWDIASGHFHNALEMACDRIEELELLEKDWKDLRFKDWRGLIRQYEWRIEELERDIDKAHDMELYEIKRREKAETRIEELERDAASLFRAAETLQIALTDRDARIDKLREALNKILELRGALQTSAFCSATPLAEVARAALEADDANT